MIDSLEALVLRFSYSLADNSDFPKLADILATDSDTLLQRLDKSPLVEITMPTQFPRTPFPHLPRSVQSVLA